MLMQTKLKKKQVPDEAVEQFFICIRARAQDKITSLIDEYGPLILNRIEHQKRLPCIFIILQQHDQNHRLKYIKLMMESGANPYFETIDNQNILFYVCAKGDDNCLILHYLLEYGMSMEKTDRFGQTPLFYIAKNSQINALQFLLKRNAIGDINHQDKFSQTALFYAASYGNIEMVRLLIKIGAKVQHLDLEFKTALYYARKNGNGGIVTYLSSISNAPPPQNTPIQSSSSPESNEESHNHNRSHTSNQNKLLKQKYNVYQIKHLNEYTNVQYVTVDEIAHFQSDIFVRLLQEPTKIDNFMKEYYDSAPWKERAEYYLSICMNCEGSQHFNQPVDEQKYGITGYYQIIKNPMDFSTIKSKLMREEYSNLQKFNEDVQLVFDNCVLYNGELNPITKIAFAIRAVYEEVIKF